MSRLAIYLLGPPRVELDGQPVHIGRAKAVALLAYLALEGGPHRRDTLATLLWPDYDQSSARAHLRRALVSLTNRLGREWFVADRASIGFAPDAALWLDVDQLRERLAACEAPGFPASDEGLAQLTEATELYRDGCMAGFTLPDAPEFDAWQRFQARSLQDELGQALEQLSACHAARGAYEPAIRCARRWLALDTLHEPAHRQLMALYAQTGRRSAALRQYRDCARVLEEELGVPPEGATTALYERIRAERTRPEGPAAIRQLGPVPAFLADEAKEIAVEQPLFVARERELARLDQHLEDALAGKGRVAFISGGPGRGKTALMRAFGQRALEAHPGLLVASGTCNAFSGAGDPYLPFREMMGMLSGDVEARWTAGTVSSEHARRLWDVLPETLAALLDHGPHLIDVLVPGGTLVSRARTFETLRDSQSLRVLRVSELQDWLERPRVSGGGLGQERILQQAADTLIALSRSHPLLLTLDDLQWTDSASAALLFHLGRQLMEAGGRILILGAYRPEEVALDRPATGFAQHPERSERTGERERHPLKKVLGELRRHLGDVGLDLAMADEVEGRAFVEAYLDSAPNRLGEAFRVALAERTGGHPLFTVELLRGMQARGELVQDVQGAWIAGPAVDWATLPVRVEAAIQERIERLDEEARDLLAVASVEGEVFTAQAVAQAQGLPEREVLHALSRELGPLGHRLVREAGEVAVEGRFLSCFQFGHALFQAYLYERLSAGERRLLHREIGDALEGLYEGHPDAIAPALAGHYLAAGYREKAAAYSVRAGGLAQATGAHAEAGHHHMNALALYREIGDRAGEAMVLGWRLAGDCIYQDKFAEGKAYEVEALSIYRELNDRQGEAWMLNRLGWMHLYSAESARAESYLQDALDVFGAIDDIVGRANALCGLGRLYREYTGDFARSQACGEEALRLVCQKADASYTEAVARYVIGFALHYQGDYSTADPYLKHAVQLFHNDGWPDANAGRVGVGLNAAALGDYAAALSHLEDARRGFREFRMEDVDDDAWVQSALALLYHQLGEDGTAREYAAHALAIHRETGYDYRTATALTRLGHALAALGEMTEAAAAYQEALDMRRQMGQRHLAPEPHAGLARVALARNDPASALNHVEAILSHLEIGGPSSSSGCRVDGTDEPLRIYITCYRVLRAYGDPRADEVLQSAYGLLQERAAKIDDERLRRSYLENVAVHSELVNEWRSVNRRR